MSCTTKDDHVDLTSSTDQPGNPLETETPTTLEDDDMDLVPIVTDPPADPSPDSPAIHSTDTQNILDYILKNTIGLILPQFEKYKRTILCSLFKDNEHLIWQIANETALHEEEIDIYAKHINELEETNETLYADIVRLPDRNDTQGSKLAKLEHSLAKKSELEAP
ncbi:MAG: hypothetical protein M1827_002117 [Pycnora praestabilis]|nr:MAG: hypothetical protein M1827_002117 [Pycnora praestabilis]